MKTKLLALAIAAVILAVAVTPALAAHGARKTTATYAVCSTTDCIEVGQHKHDRKTYSAHYYGDGHDYHDYCEVNDCTLDGYHAHDGTYCFSQPVSQTAVSSRQGCHRSYGGCR